MSSNVMKSKAEFFSERKTTVHISITNSPRFYNGIILEVHDLFVVINDRRNGEMPVYFEEIEKMEKFREVENEYLD